MGLEQAHRIRGAQSACYPRETGVGSTAVLHDSNSSNGSSSGNSIGSSDIGVFHGEGGVVNAQSSLVGPGRGKKTAGVSRTAVAEGTGGRGRRRGGGGGTGLVGSSRNDVGVEERSERTGTRGCAAFGDGYSDVGSGNGGGVSLNRLFGGHVRGRGGGGGRRSSVGVGGDREVDGGGGGGGWVYEMKGGGGGGGGREESISFGARPSSTATRAAAVVVSSADTRPARLAARLGALEAKINAGESGGGDGCGGGSPRYSGFGSVVGRVGDVREPLTADEGDSQSAALRHALLLEERGLQLEEAELLLIRKEEDEAALRREVQCLREASITDMDTRRRLSEAKDDVSSLLKRSEALEELAEKRQRELEEERRAWNLERRELAADLERVTREAAAAGEAVLREGAAANSSRKLCEQMGGVCRQMRQAAEEGGQRSAEAEENVRSLEAELGAARNRASKAESEKKALRGTVEAARQEAERESKACKNERDSVVALKVLLEDREARLARADSEALATGRRMKTAVDEAARHKETSERLEGELERSQTEVERLRSRLEAAGDVAAGEADRAKEAQDSEMLTRSQLASAGEREATLRHENAGLKSKTEELNLLLATLSADLSRSSKLAQDRLVETEVSAREAAKAKHDLELQNRRLEDETVKVLTANRTAELSANAAESATVRAETIKEEGERAMAGFQDSVACALQRVEDALADALQGVGEGRSDDAAAALVVSSSSSSPALLTNMSTSKLGRVLARIMRRLAAAKGFRTWVACEVEGSGREAIEGLKELRGRWEGQLGRLKKAEGMLVRLQEEAKYGGRRAALDAREACYAKLERAEKEKWSLKSRLASQEKEADVLRSHLTRTKEGSDQAAASAEEAHRAVCERLDAERLKRRKLQDKTELLEGEASLLEENLSTISDQLNHCRENELQQQQQLAQQQQDRERLLQSQETLRSELSQEKQNAEQTRKTAEDAEKAAQERFQEFSREREKDRGLLAKETKEFSRVLEDERVSREKEAVRLAGLLEEERTLREKEGFRMSSLLEEERTIRDEETGRLACMLEEERKARLAESALGEAVLREVRETQSLLGEVSPPNGRSRLEGGIDTSVRGEDPVGLRTVDYLEALESQALMLDGVVSDTAALIKHTGIFYDRYSATHRDSTANATATTAAAASYSGNLRNVINPTAGTKHSHGVSSAEPWQRGIDNHRLFINTKPNAATAGNNVSNTSDREEWAKKRVAEGARQEENSGNFLGRKVEAGAKELQQLDRQCYSLLDSNAQLCLRLQELGLDYAGLARRLASEEREKHGVVGDAALKVTDLENHHYSSSDLLPGRRDGQDHRHRPRHDSTPEGSYHHQNEHHHPGRRRNTKARSSRTMALRGPPPPPPLAVDGAFGEDEYRSPDRSADRSADRSPHRYYNSDGGNDESMMLGHRAARDRVRGRSRDNYAYRSGDRYGARSATRSDNGCSPGRPGLARRSVDQRANNRSVDNYYCVEHATGHRYADRSVDRSAQDFASPSAESDAKRRHNNSSYGCCRERQARREETPRLLHQHNISGHSRAAVRAVSSKRAAASCTLDSRGVDSAGCVK